MGQLRSAVRALALDRPRPGRAARGARRVRAPPRGRARSRRSCYARARPRLGACCGTPAPGHPPPVVVDPGRGRRLPVGRSLAPAGRRTPAAPRRRGGVRAAARPDGCCSTPTGSWSGARPLARRGDAVRCVGAVGRAPRPGAGGADRGADRRARRGAAGSRTTCACSRCAAPATSSGRSGSAAHHANMCSYGAPRRRRRVLRLRRPARRPVAARAAGRRRGLGGHGGELRGARVRHPRRDADGPGAAAVPAAADRRPLVGGLQRGEPRGVRDLRPPRGRRAARLARGGVPARPRHARRRGRARRAAAARGARRGRAAPERRHRGHEGAGEDREPLREARRPVPRAAGRRARVPAPAAGRAHLGRRAGDGGQAARARDAGRLRRPRR